ncbi:MAG: hypothetical protein GVX78_03430, partial [Bacteroidetes bacterium]|nr:hypothetical protein [Bacteroidota bacterium]
MNKASRREGVNQKDSIWIIPFVLFLGIDIFFIHFDLEAYRWFSKPALMSILLIALWNTARYDLRYNFRLHLLALLLSLIGDLFLLTDLFLTGLISFLWAHVCYMILMANIGIDLKGIRFWIRAIITVILGVSVGYYIGHFHPEFQWAIIFYTIVILMMLQFAYLVRPNSTLLIAGAIFFVVSDFLLAYGRFIPP